MRKLIGVLLSVVLMLAYAGVCSAQDVEIITEGNEWVKRKVEVVRTEMGRYVAPPFQVPDKDKSTVFAIMEAGQGEYEISQGIRMELQWDLPMQSKKYKVKTGAVFKDGVWSDPKLETVSPEIMENDWVLTALLAIIAIGVLSICVAHQKSGKRDWWLLVFYGALVVMAGSVFIDNPLYIAIAFFIAAAAIIIAAITSAAAIIIAATTFIASTTAFSIFSAAITDDKKQIEYVVFMACVIILGYAIAKLAKRLGWIKVVEKPTTSA